MKLFKKDDPNNKLKLLVLIEGVILVALMITTIIVAIKKFG